MAKILLADDNVDFVQLITEVLRRDGHDLDTAENGRIAIDMLAKNNSYDLIISDLIMPEIDGMGLIRYINDMESKPPVIALSGGGLTIAAGDVLKTVESLVDVVIQKPVDLDVLVEEIDKLVG